MDLKSLPSTLLYSMARYRWKYGRKDLETYIKNIWFVDPIYKHKTGHRPRWGYGSTIPDADLEVVKGCQALMREFCTLSDLEVETLLISKSTLDAAKYSVKHKGERLVPEAEAKFLELCKGRKSRLNALLTYCGRWDMMPENMTEITLVAGFEGGRRGQIGSDFMKKLSDNKRRCRELLAQIMKMEGIGEDEPIAKIMERLG